MDFSFVPTGLPEIDSKVGGMARGSITEIFGQTSTGKSRLMLSVLQRIADRMESAAIVDVTNSFDPTCAKDSGVDLDRILWILCGGNLDAAFKSADYLLHAGGFGIVVLDLADVRPETVKRIPLSYWFRFRLAVEKTSTVLLLLSPAPCAGSSCSESLEISRSIASWSGARHHLLLKGFDFQVGFRRSRSRRQDQLKRAHA